MQPAGSRVGGEGRPTILVMAVPYVVATALASQLRSHYDVVAPNLDAGHAVPSIRWDAVLALRAVPVPKDISGMIIRLPNTSFNEPVTVTVDDCTISVEVARSHPIEDVVAILDHHLLPPS